MYIIMEVLQYCWNKLHNVTLKYSTGLWGIIIYYYGQEICMYAHSTSMEGIIIIYIWVISFLR